MDDAAVRHEILSRFPDGVLRDVKFQRHDTAAVPGVLEPGDIAVKLVLAGPEEHRADPAKVPIEASERVVEAFVYEYHPILHALVNELPALVDDRLRSLVVGYGHWGQGLDVRGGRAARRGRDDHAKDDAAVRQAILSRFPEGTLLDVRFLRFDPSQQPGVLEPGEVSVFLVPRGPDEYTDDPDRAPLAVCDEVVREFLHRYLPTVQEVRKELPGLLSERLRTSGVNYGQRWESVTTMESPAGLVPVMTRLAPTDVETLDLLIAAGMASSRAEAVRWCLGRIRERPAFQELQASVRRIEQLKAAF